MTGLRGFSGWVSPVESVRRIRWWHHLVTGIKRTAVIWPGSSNDQMRRYLPRPPSEIQDNMSSMFSSIVRHKRQVFTFLFESWVYWGYVLQHLHSKGRIPPAHRVRWEASQMVARLSNLTFFLSSLAHISSSTPCGVNYYHIKCLQFTNLLKSGAPCGLNYNLLNLVNTHFVKSNHRMSALLWS